MSSWLRSVSFLWIPASLLLVLAGSWFTLMELLLHPPGFAVRAGVASLIVVYAVLCLRSSRSHSASLRAVVSLAALSILALGIYAVFADLHATHFEGYILLVSVALIGQSLLTLTQTVPRAILHGV